MNSRTILHYQELASNAWPAKIHIFLHGWVLRLSEGVTRRANSVLPLRYTGEDVVQDVKTVENLYREKGLPVVFQLPDYFEPENLRETLVSRGYKCVDESLVLTAKIEDIHTAHQEGCTYALAYEGTDQWFQALADLSHFNQQSLRGQKSIIERIPFSSKVFCCARTNNKIVGVGLGVVQQKVLGMYSIVVHSGYRRRGIGQSMVGHILQWGRASSVNYVYLQVQGDNRGAISLYEKIGFKECYRYRYFVTSRREGTT
jgi:ribosomal protein S18 acetylase RimI-like enzyme